MVKIIYVDELRTFWSGQPFTETSDEIVRSADHLVHLIDTSLNESMRKRATYVEMCNSRSNSFKILRKVPAVAKRFVIK